MPWGLEPNCETNATLFGDVNGDCDYSIDDVVFLATEYTKPEEQRFAGWCSQRMQLANPDHTADATGNPSIDTVDLQYLLLTLLSTHRFLGEYGASCTHNIGVDNSVAALVQHSIKHSVLMWDDRYGYVHSN